MALAPRAFASGSGTNDPGLTIPSSVQTGDGMVLIAEANLDCNFSTPAGWTIADAKKVSEAGGVNSIVYKRVAQSGDANSALSVHNDGVAGVKAVIMLAVYSGSDPVDPIHVLQSRLDTGGTASTLSPSATTTEPDTYVMEVACTKSSSSTTYGTKPAGSTSRLEVIGTGGGHVDGVLVDRGPVAAGPYGNNTFTADATLSSAVTYTIAVLPKSSTQTLRPLTDITVDAGYNAVPSVGTGVALASRIGEGARDDASYIESASNPTADVYETRLGAGLDPLSSADHKVSVVLSTAGGAVSSTFVVALVQGTTVKATRTYTDVPETPTLYEFTLTTPEADSITDYSDLRLRFTITAA